MLQVAVDHGHAFALRVLQTREDRRLLAEIPRKAHAAHACVGCRSSLNARPCGVLRAVVDEDQLVRDLRLRQHCADLLRGGRDGLFLIICRDHYG